MRFKTILLICCFILLFAVSVESDMLGFFYSRSRGGDSGDELLLETGDKLLLETGDTLLLETP